MQRLNWKNPLQKQPLRKTFKRLLLKLILDVKSCPQQHSVYRIFRHQEIRLNSCILCCGNKNSEI